ncbi:MAG: ABC transporter ATP-binding protein/permease [Alphaproteobacteria bacterium]|nr:ABC transporter ATP-binding protein/permease [Alphaproteobacteria bacterium]
MNAKGQQPTQSQNDQRVVAQVVLRLFSLLWPKRESALKARVVGALILIIVGKGISVVAPFLYKHVIDTLIAAPIYAPIALIVAYGVANALNQLTGELREYLFVTVSQRAIRITSLDVFRKLHALSLRFHLNRQTGGIATIIARGTTGMEFLLELVLFSIFPTIVELALVSAVLFRLYHPSFAIITIMTIASYLGFTLLMTRWQVRFRKEMNMLDVAASMKAIDSLMNYETVKYFTAEEAEARRFDTAKRAYESAAIRNQTVQVLFNIGRSLITATGAILVMVLAGGRVVTGAMTIGDFVLVNAYLLQLYAPLHALSLVYTQIKQSLADVEAMLGLLSQRPEVEDTPGACALTVGRGGVSFRNVLFHYDKRRPLLEDISFDIPAGKTVAIVGPSGAGKSTIARLLFRFYDVNGGKILIDGHDICTVTQDSLRNAIGVVPQDTVLFHDSLFYNIAYGKIGASRKDVERAAKAAQLGEFIARLPDGIDTQVGERGLKLSGGEKQRVAIARVILKNPRILIFDEATSALDSATEQEILRSLNDIASERTTLVIAHRLSTIINADEILVLCNGRIEERGKHEALIHQNGLYRDLWRRQQMSQSDNDIL